MLLLILAHPGYKSRRSIQHVDSETGGGGRREGLEVLSVAPPPQFHENEIFFLLLSLSFVWKKDLALTLKCPFLRGEL